MPKKTILLGSLILLAGGLFFLTQFYKKNLSGAWPAILPPSTPTSRDTPSSATSSPTSKNETGLPLTLPEGITISHFSKSTPGARDLEFDPQGRLFVSLSGSGQVVAIPEANQVVTVLSDLNRPHGLAFNGNTLYVAETDAVSTYDYNPQTLKAANRKKIIDLPGGGNHWSRSLLIKDGKLYIAVGSTCNVCNEQDWRRTKILQSNLDGTDLKAYASGLRNSVFLVTNPLTNEIWATEMGRDLLGDDTPPDEINIISQDKSYGWPICYGKNIHDTNFDKKTYQSPPCEQPNQLPSLIDLPAHSAPLGLAFIPQSWPENLRGKLLVAFHGSWNRSVPTGYKISLVDPASANLTDFISGWLKPPKDSYGRPVDLIFDKSGNLFVSDDKAGSIYKITPSGL